MKWWSNSLANKEMQNKKKLKFTNERTIKPVSLEIFKVSWARVPCMHLCDSVDLCLSLLKLYNESAVLLYPLRIFSK